MLTEKEELEKVIEEMKMKGEKKRKKHSDEEEKKVDHSMDCSFRSSRSSKS